MMLWIQKLKALFSLADRILFIEKEINEIDSRIKKSMEEHSKQFEKKIQKMSFAYTKNLDDTKSDYLKRYLEVRMNCVQQELNALPAKLGAMRDDILKLENKIEKQDDDE